MITIKTPTLSLFSTLNTLSFFTLINIFSVTAVYGENSDGVARQEPIFPLPESIIYDADKAALGEILFSDARLSKNSRFSCASCHQLENGGDDNLTHGLSLSADHNVVNTPSIFNAQFNFRQNWDGAAKTLENQIELTMQNQHEFGNSWTDVTKKLNKDVLLANHFNNVYQNGINRDNIIDALIEFEKTLITPNSRFDRYLRDADIHLSMEEEQGYKLFKEYGCIACHQGINVGGNLFQKFGVFYDYLSERGEISKADYGRFNITDRPFDRFVFKVPSLRNIEVTAPYLHDGSAATLEEAIFIMGRTQLGRTLTKEDIQLIKAFLKTLTGEYKNIPLGSRP